MLTIVQLLLIIGILLALASQLFIMAQNNNKQKIRIIPFSIVTLGSIILIVTAFYYIDVLRTVLLDEYYHHSDLSILLTIGLMLWWSLMSIPALIVWISITLFYYSRRKANKYFRILNWLSLIGIIAGVFFGIKFYIWMHSPGGYPR